MANQIIAVDWSETEDYTAVTSMCSSCKTVIYTDYTVISKSMVNTPLYKHCPVCKKEFKHIVKC